MRVKEYINEEYNYIAVKRENQAGREHYYQTEKANEYFSNWMEEEVIKTDRFEEDGKKFILLIIK